MTATQKDIYAKVDNQLIVEFPVTVDTILARGHSVFSYTPVIFDEKPLFNDEIQTAVHALRIQDGAVHVAYDILPMPLATILASFKGQEGPRKVADLSELALQYAKSLTSNHIETKINQLAGMRGYTSLNNALGRYSNSSNPKYKKEAAFIQKALDDAWAKLEVYFSDIMTDKVPVPTTVDEIDAVVTVPTWNDFVA